MKIFDVSECKIRLMTEADLKTVLAWRNSDRIRANMYSDHIISIEEHQAWFERTLNDKRSIHLIFEYKKQPIGLTSYVEISEKDASCFSGAYIGEDDVLIGAGVIMSFLCTTYIFEATNMRKISIEIFAFNKQVISYEKKFGYIQEGYFKEHILKNGSYQDIVRLALFKEAWQKSKPKLERLIFRGKKLDFNYFY